MKITRHIRYIDNEIQCFKADIPFDPPVEIESSLGRSDPDMFKGVSSEVINLKKNLMETPAIVNDGNVLEINEVMKPGELLSIELRPDHRLDKIVLDPEHQKLLLVGKVGLVYRFIIGKNGVFNVIAKMIPDDDHFFSKIRADITDVAMREYFMKRSLADSEIAHELIEKVPEVLGKEQAARYLDVSVSWLEKKAASGEIPRTRHKKYRKSDLDVWMNSNPKKRKRS